MDHFAFPTIDSFVEKHNRSSNWEAVVESSTKDDGSALQLGSVKGKRRLRRIFASFHFAPPFGFCMFTCIRKVFLTDGGYVFAKLNAQYEFLSQTKAKAISRSRKESR